MQKTQFALAGTVLRVFCFSFSFPHVTIVSDELASVGLPFYHFPVDFLMKGLILVASLQNSTLMIHHSIGDEMSCSVSVEHREKLSMTVMPGEERVHPSLVSFEAFEA